MSALVSKEKKKILDFILELTLLNRFIVDTVYNSNNAFKQKVLGRNYNVMFILNGSEILKMEMIHGNQLL
jgi:hypothetical protein